MLDEYVIAASAGVIVAAVVILATLLSRYSKLVREADVANRLAKDVWDSVNSRFTVMDARIIDLMAKTEVFASRSGAHQSAFLPRAVQTQAAPSPPVKASQAVSSKQVVRSSFEIGENTETEIKVLRFLAKGAKTSAQIKDEVGRSREHTARMMKMLFDRGLVVRNDRTKPYVYEITDIGKSYVGN